MATAVSLLLVGVIAGFGIASLVGGDDAQQTGAERLIGYNVTDMAVADRTDAGAVKAATALLIGLPGLAVSNEQEIDRVLDANIDPTARPALDAVVNAARGRLQSVVDNPSRVGTAKILVIPASYRVRIIDPNTTVVQIWRLTVFLESTGAVVQGAWTTDDITLRWNDRWRVSAYTQASGPSPPVFSASAIPANYAEMQAVLNNSYAYQPSLAGQ